MEYKTGFSVKPTSVLPSGKVIFTDGTNDFMPNQLQCEAYGYIYNRVSGTCSAFTTNNKLGITERNSKNFIKGSNNTTETGTNNTLIMGENNTVKGISRNNLVIGNSNEISNGVNNATVLGNYGIAQRDGEIVFGGGAFDGAGAGYGQSSTISLSGLTTNATQTNLKVNSSRTNTIIARGSTSSFQGFEAHIIGVRTDVGGDAIFLKATGIVYQKLENQTVATSGSFGTVTGWTSAIVFSATNDMHLSVTGAAGKNISWSATLHLYEIKI
jgi:hypothetical protein